MTKYSLFVLVALLCVPVNTIGDQSDHKYLFPSLVPEEWVEFLQEYAPEGANIIPGPSILTCQGPLPEAIELYQNTTSREGVPPAVVPDPLSPANTIHILSNIRVSTDSKRLVVVCSCVVLLLGPE